MAYTRRQRETEMPNNHHDEDPINLDDVTLLSDEEDDQDLINKNLLSMIVRIINPTSISVAGLVDAMPNITKLFNQLQGRAVGKDRAQFFFPSEELLLKTLADGPWYINNWLVTGERWSPSPEPNFLERILLWVRIRGIPLHKIAESKIRSIAEKLGQVEQIKPHAKNSESVEYVQAQIWFPTSEPLVFQKAYCFKTGDPFTVTLTYDKLKRYCYFCKRINHDQYRCPEKHVHDNKNRATPQEEHSIPNRATRRTQHQSGRITEEQTEAPVKPSTKGRPRGRPTKRTQEASVSDQAPSDFQRLGADQNRTQWRVKKAQTSNSRDTLSCDQTEKQTQNNSPLTDQMVLSSGKRVDPPLKPGEKILPSGIRVASPNLNPGERILSSGRVVSPPEPFVFASEVTEGRKRKRRFQAQKNAAHKRTKGLTDAVQRNLSESTGYDLHTPVRNNISSSQRFVVNQKPHRSI